MSDTSPNNIPNHLDPNMGRPHTCCRFFCHGQGNCPRPECTNQAHGTSLSVFSPGDQRLLDALMANDDSAINAALGLPENRSTQE